MIVQAEVDDLLEALFSNFNLVSMHFRVAPVSL
jgi:hypothetical protein